MHVNHLFDAVAHVDVLSASAAKALDLQVVEIELGDLSKAVSSTATYAPELNPSNASWETRSPMRLAITQASTRST